MKKCSKSELLQMLMKFHNYNSSNDGLYQHCKSCQKDFYLKNSHKKFRNKKEWIKIFKIGETYILKTEEKKILIS